MQQPWRQLVAGRRADDRSGDKPGGVEPSIA